MNRTNVGMVKGGGGHRLPLETLTAFLISHQVRHQELNRYVASELGVLGLGRVEWWRTALRDWPIRPNGTRNVV